MVMEGVKPAAYLMTFEICFGPEKGLFDDDDERLTTESIQGSALTFQRVDDVHGGDGLSLGVLRVGDCIANDVLEEDLEDTARLLVDQTGDALHSASTSQTTDGRFRDALDVVTKHLAMTLRSTLAQPFTSFASSRHSSSDLRYTTEYA
jgi:hypothetical protein